jgi:hypothetical protein
MSQPRRLTTLRVRIMPDGPTVTVTGRNAWALNALMKAGAGGCTPIGHPGPRWSSYVHKLRRTGIAIATISEAHGGPFAGEHARYVLCSTIEVINDGEGHS